MDDNAILSDLARAEIEILKADGITLTPDEIVEINALAWAVENPSHRMHLSRGVPVHVAGIALWPITLYAADWYVRVGSQLKGDMADYAMAYAMAHAYDDGDAMDMGVYDAKRAVKRWVNSLRCTPSALIEATRQVMTQDESPPIAQSADDTPMTPGDFSAFLASVTGGTPEFWERRVAFSYCRAMLATIAMQNRADKTPCSQDPRMIATRALGMAAARIRKSREEKADV